MPEFWAYNTAAFTSENWAEVGATVTAEIAPVAVPLAKDAEDPDMEDALVGRVASLPELEEDTVFDALEVRVEDEMPDALLAEIEVAEVADDDDDDDELTGELIAPAFWLASEL